MRNLYVLVILEPGCRSKVAARRVSRRPLRELHPGEVVRVRGRRLRVQRVRTYVEEHDGVIEHVTVVSTRAATSRAAKRVLKRDIENVVRMPAGDNSVIGQFIRYHVLVRVYDGDADAWLAHLRARGAGDPAAGGDIRFVHWIRSRLRQEPGLLAAIRRMVDATPFWRAAAQR